MKRFKGWTLSDKYSVWYKVTRNPDKKEVRHVDVWDSRNDIEYRCKPSSKPDHFKETRTSGSVSWNELRAIECSPSSNVISLVKGILFPQKNGVAMKKETGQLNLF